MSTALQIIQSFPRPNLPQEINSKVPMTGMERSIGQLQGTVDAIKDTLGRLVTTQDESRREEADSRRRMYERLEAHEIKMSKAFAEMHDRMVRQEASTDMIESHAEALVELEKRVEHQETRVKVQSKISDTNRRWVYGLLAFLGVIEGDHVTGSKLLKVIASIFGAK